ncbi:death domain-containing protein 1-like isoform X1 [Liolophura sinensis]|uniref:death domain-containing protein 1-like isoform X1 n=1 Tax=Liolophura sinensis TaxID=3198878 RepID=UPI0031592A66
MSAIPNTVPDPDQTIQSGKGKEKDRVESPRVRRQRKNSPDPSKSCSGNTAEEREVDKNPENEAQENSEEKSISPENSSSKETEDSETDERKFTTITSNGSESDRKEDTKQEGSVTGEGAKLQAEASRLKDVLADVGKFLQSANVFVREEFHTFQKMPLKSYSPQMSRLKDVVKTIVMTCQLFDSVSSECNKEMKTLRLAVDEMAEFLKKAVITEDLTVWLDLPPDAEEEQMRLAEERRAADKVRLSKAAEARAEVAKATTNIVEAEKCAALANVDLLETIAEATRAEEEAKLALKAAEEARIAAELKLKAEEEARCLAEERAKKKAEEEKRKAKEEERHLAELASKKGTSVTDERLAYAQKKAREEEEKKNPRNWPRFIYSIDPGDYDPGVGCVIRAVAGSVLRDEIIVNRVDSLADIAVLEESEELISNVIAVSSDKDISTEEPMSISIPHCGPRGHTSREPVIKTIDPSGKWVEVPTKDITFEDIRELKFVEARVHRLGTFMVVLRPKRDHLIFTKKGGKISSTTDPRVTLNVRPGMFRVNANVTLEVHPIDMAQVSDVKARFPSNCSDLLSSSPIVRFCIANRKLSKPINVTVPLPPSASRPRQRPATAVSRDRTDRSDKRPSTAKAILSSASSLQKQEEDSTPEENLYLLSRTNCSDQWSLVNGVPLTHQKNKDIVSFSMVDPYERFMVISTKTAVSELQAEKISERIEGALRQKTVCLILRQNNSDPGDVVLACTLMSQSDRLLQQLSEEDYDEGPPPSKPFIVKEGQIMEIRFRGNVQRQNSQEGLRFVYNSRIKCLMHFSVEEIDKFAQKSFDCYRGFAQVYTKVLVPVQEQSEEEKARNNHMQRNTAWEEGDTLLGELLISLPKPDPEPPKPLNTAPVTLKSEGPVDDDVLKRISEDLGDEWKRLAQCLNVRKMRIQAILRQNHNNDTQCSIHDMLLTWAKRLPRSVNKVEILASALVSVGRTDLAEDIRGKDYDIRQQRAQSAKDSHLRRVFVKIAQDVHVTKQWKALAKQMGLTLGEISQIEEYVGTGPDRCLHALRHWHNKMGNKATKTVLLKHLRICRFTQAVNVIQTVS